MRSAATITWLVFLGAGAYVVGLPALILWLSGDWRWVEGWIFGIWFAGLFAASLAWLYCKDPALLRERFRRPGTGGQSRADLAILMAVKLGTIAWVILPPLDVHFGWMPRPPQWMEPFGGILLLPATFFFFRSITDNTFLSQLVRIQSERQHHVIDTGVYSFVRHPMYLGASLMFVGGALLLRSLCGLLTAFCLVVLLVLRILGEEALLARHLAGYTAYRERVCYRLVPLVW